MSVVRRTLTGVAIAAAVAGLIALDAAFPEGPLLWTVLSVFGMLAAWEATRMLGGRRTVGLALVAATLATFAAAYLQEEHGLFGASGAAGRLAAPAAAAVVVGLGLARRAAGLFAVWIAVPLVALALWTRAFGHDALVALIALSKVGDIAGYFVGRRFGRFHPFKRLSPGKTVAGCAASALAGVLLGAVFGAYWTLGPESPDALGGGGALRGASVGLLLNLAAQAGDLFESAVKRSGGVKDSGVLMGASGGVLDVLDSLLFTAPLAWLVVPQLV